jgi:hypothetical protein
MQSYAHQAHHSVLTHNRPLGSCLVADCVSVHYDAAAGPAPLICCSTCRSSSAWTEDPVNELVETINFWVSINTPINQSCEHFFLVVWLVVTKTGMERAAAREGNAGWPKRWMGKVILDFYSLKCLVRWIVGRTGKLGRDVVKTLIIISLDNQAFHGLIIKPFDNQTVSRLWLSRISDTSENKPERLDSDNQINISRLISFLAQFEHWEWFSQSRGELLNGMFGPRATMRSAVFFK